MSKALVVGDMHLKQGLILPRVDDAVRATGARRVVFCGDYVDEWGCSDAEEVAALDLQLEWAETCRADGLEIEFLMGNHDWCYLQAEPEHYSHVHVLAEVTERLLALGLKPATTVGGWLVTHAGLTHSWAVAHAVPHGSAGEVAAALNAKAETDVGMRALYSCGRARGGWELPGPLWADLRELERDMEDGLNQIIGHTPVFTCTNKEVGPGGEQVVAVDTFSLTSTLTAIGDASMLLVDEESGKTEVFYGSVSDPWDLIIDDWRMGC